MKSKKQEIKDKLFKNVYEWILGTLESFVQLHEKEFWRVWTQDLKNLIFQIHTYFNLIKLYGNKPRKRKPKGFP